MREFPRSGRADRIFWPVTAYVVLLLAVAAGCLFTVGSVTPARPVAGTGPLAQSRVEQLAQAVAAAAAADSADLDVLVRNSAGMSAPRVAEAVLRAPARWTGVVVESAAATGSGGEPVPPLDAISPLDAAAGGPVFRTAVPSGGGLTLITSTEANGVRVTATSWLPVPVAATLWLVDPGGGTRPVTPAASSARDPLLVARAAGTGGSGYFAELSPDAGSDQIAAFAPVGALPLGLVVVVPVPTPTLDPGGKGVLPALALGLVAVVGGMLLWHGMVRPVRRLRSSTEHLARHELSVAVPQSRVAEPAQLAWAIETCRGVLTAVPVSRAPRWFYWPTSAVNTAAALMVLLWSAAVVALVPPLVEIDAAVLSTASQRAELEAGRAAAALNEGLRTVRVAARDSPATDELAVRLRALAGPKAWFHGIRVVGTGGDRSGGDRSVGRPLLRGVPGGDGIELTAVSGLAVPVPTATVARGDGSSIVAEFDVRRLVRALHSPQHRVRVFDAAGRTVVDTAGFVALQPVGDLDVEALLARGSGSALAGDVVLAAAPLRLGPSASLGWTLVTQQPVSVLPVPGGDVGRRVNLVALLAALVASFVWVANMVWHVLPMRSAARMASALIRGDTASVIFPQHHDDIGATLGYLDMVRRAAYEDAVLPSEGH